MPPKKRKFNDDGDFDDEEYKEDDEIIKKPKKLPKVKIEVSPPVNNLKDLIEIGKTLKFYKNIDVIILWNILPYLEELDKMIGMKSLKETIFYQIIYYLQNFHKRNRNEEYLHTIITGKAGCGKTTIAKIIGKIYSGLEILSKRESTFTIGYREDFVAEYLGQTAIKTRNFLESCLGGVLFIDEVYSLGPGQKDRDSFSKEAIDTICSFLSEHKNDFCCIIAGYKEEVKKCFLSVNPGLERRFPWRHDIEDYTNKDLTKIFIKMIKDINWSLKDEEISEEYLDNFFKDNVAYFENTGGSIETFISKIKMVHSKRVFCLDKEFKFIITKEDLINGINEVKKHTLQKKDTTPMFMYL